MDVHNSEQRHKNMAAVRSKDTKPEMVVRKYLWSRGFRYRVNNPRLPGHPDIVLRKYHTCIFVNGCFWHQHGCRFTSRPKSNSDFWNNKFDANVARDVKVLRKLSLQDCRVAIVWECSLKRNEERSLERLVDFIRSDEEFVEI